MTSGDLQTLADFMALLERLIDARVCEALAATMPPLDEVTDVPEDAVPNGSARPQ